MRRKGAIIWIGILYEGITKIRRIYIDRVREVCRNNWNVCSGRLEKYPQEKILAVIDGGPLFIYFLSKRLLGEETQGG